MKKGTKSIFYAVVLSLAVHAAVGAALLYKSDDKFNFSESLNKLNLVWVALEGKNKKEINNAPPQTSVQHPAVREKAAEENAGKRPAVAGAERETAAVPAVANSSVPAVSVLSESAAKSAAKRQVHNAAGNGVSEEAAVLLPVQEVKAYPLYRENTPPVYPEIARRRGYEGVVLVAAEILPDGCVGHLKIRKSSGYAVLDQSAMEAVKPWKFEPARKSGKPFTVWVELPIKFVLQNDDNTQS